MLVEKILNITTDTYPVTLEFNTNSTCVNCISLPDTVVFESAEELEDYILVINILDNDCASTCTVDVTVNNTKCTATDTIDLSTDVQPCGIEITDILETDYLTFIPQISNVDPNATIASYNWSYNTTDFELNSETVPTDLDQILYLSLSPTTVNSISNYTICLSVIDSNGCEASFCKTFDTCEINSIVEYSTYDTICTSTAMYSMRFDSCNNLNDLDWNRYTVTLLDSTSTVVSNTRYIVDITFPVGTPTVNFRFIDPNMPTGQYTLIVAVKDMFNNTSLNHQYINHTICP